VNNFEKYIDPLISSPKPDLDDTRQVIDLDSELFIKHTFEQSFEEGFTLLFRRYHGVLCSHASRLVLSKDIAKDIVSDVFFSLWKNQESLQITASYRSYLFRAVRNGCHNYLIRELNRRADVNTLSEFESNCATPDHLVYFDELRQKIDQTVAQLSPQCKRVFILSRYDGKKYAEIAIELNLSVKTIEMHVSKALQSLRVALKGDWLLAIIVIPSLLALS
jgi:RNA polymerase sigma-70 factor (ECF subfamily)